MRSPILSSCALVSLLIACGGTEPSGGGGGGGGGGTVAIAKASPSGDAQTATVATAVANALRVLVTQNGSPAAGQSVTWSAGSGGTVSASSTTDVSGIASTQWTLGQTAGTQSTTATLIGATGSPVSFTATATAGPAASIVKAGGDAQTGTINSVLAAPLRALIADQFGNPVSGTAVAWQVVGGSATVNPGASTSASSGEAQTVVTLGGTAGTITIEAVSTGLTGSPLSFTAMATAPPMLATVQVVNNQFQPAAVTIAVGGTVTWDWPSTAINHNVSPDATEPVRSGNPVNGPNMYQHTFNTPGTYQYFCEVHGAPGLIGMSGTITVQ
ncbi:MAG: hypothetical protein HKM89_07255 [Gemmatimonadales bacterium]|nr:hypothetical protein [Gemmatimonadales bacterium]